MVLTMVNSKFTPSLLPFVNLYPWMGHNSLVGAIQLLHQYVLAVQPWIIVTSVQCCQLSTRIPRESGIDRRKIDRRVIFKGLGKQSKIDVPSDSHAIHFHATKYPKIAWKGSNRTKIKNTFTLDALGRNKNDDEALWWDKSL